jgi:sulfatase modifying factor 1
MRMRKQASTLALCWLLVGTPALIGLSNRPVQAQASSRAILLIWNSNADAGSKNAHRAMIEELKRLRGEGVLASISGLDKKIKVYDFGLPDHAQALALLGVSKTSKMPMVSVVTLDSTGLPTKIVQSGSYTDSSDGLAVLSNCLGKQLKATSGHSTRPGQKEERRVVMVLDPDGQPQPSKVLSQFVTSHFQSVQSSDDLAKQPYSYSFAKASDRSFLESKTLKREKGPYLTVMRFVGDAPRDILWSTRVTEPELAWSELLAHLGISQSVLQTRRFVLIPPVNQSQSSYYKASWNVCVYNELRGKLNSILANSAPIGFAEQLSDSSNLPGLAGLSGGLALVETDRNGAEKSVIAKFPISDDKTADELLVAAYSSVQQVYQPPGAFLNPVDGSQMILVQGGSYTLGAATPIFNDYVKEFPIHTARLRNFYISKFEVTNRQFEQFVNATRYETEAERLGGSYVVGMGNKRVQGASWRHPKGPGSQSVPEHPVVHVTHNDADAYCSWARLELPRQDQWEFAGRGLDQRMYPSGNLVKPGDLASSMGGAQGSAGGPSIVGSHAKDLSPSGCYDLAGNVSEWMLEMFSSGVERRADDSTLHHVVKGGSWSNEEANDHRLTKRLRQETGFSSSSLGFRTALYDDRNLRPTK